jgi:CheY-like chemotaxis protein
VLLVEDNILNQALIKRYLINYGYGVTVANDGIEALEILQEKMFAVILMDIQMPRMDGYETTANIRGWQTEYFQRVPIIACTSNSHDETKANIDKYRMNDFLIKPFTSEEIIKKINQFAELCVTRPVIS